MSKIIYGLLMALTIGWSASAGGGSIASLFHIGEENFFVELFESDEYVLVRRIEEQEDSGTIDVAIAVDIGRAFLRRNQMVRCAIAHTQSVNEGASHKVYYHCPAP